MRGRRLLADSSADRECERAPVGARFAWWSGSWDCPKSALDKAVKGVYIDCVRGGIQKTEPPRSEQNGEADYNH